MIKIAHRSGPVSFPEQTVASAREAVALGADVIEIDLRETADGALAVTHDENLSRVFGIDKSIHAITGEAFRALPHRNAPECRGHLFCDYLEADIPKILVHVKEGAAIPKIIAEAEAHDRRDRIILGVQTVEDATAARAIAPEIKLLSFAKKSLIPDFIALGVDYVRIWEPWIEDELVALIKKSHSQLWIMSGEAEEGFPVGEPSEEGIRRILASDPDGVLINDVRRI